jgi:hypothetical protein
MPNHPFVLAEQPALSALKEEWLFLSRKKNNLDIWISPVKLYEDVLNVL